MGTCGCEFNSCVIQQGQFCDPVLGCTEGCVKDSDCDYLEYYYEDYDCLSGNVWKNTTYFQNYICDARHECVKGSSSVNKTKTFDCDNYSGIQIGQCGMQTSVCVESTLVCQNSTSIQDGNCPADGNFCLNENTVIHKDNYCNPATFNCAVNQTTLSYCNNDIWIGGGDQLGNEINTPPWDDPACLYKNDSCSQPSTGVAYCQQSQQYSNDFDNFDAKVCVDQKFKVSEDHWCALGTCNSVTPASGCDDGQKQFGQVCDQSCGAQCESDGNCPDDRCVEIFCDYCNATVNQLVEHQGIINNIKDSIKVEATADNTCTQGCACTDNEAVCDEPSTVSHCVQGICGATCDEKSDCPAYLQSDICYFNGNCQNSCGCSYSNVTCDPGRVEGNLCYYEDPAYQNICDEQGCHLKTCVLQPNQVCDPSDGCIYEGCSLGDECDSNEDCDAKDGYYCAGNDRVYQDWYCQLLGLCTCNYNQQLIQSCPVGISDTDNPTNSTPLDPNQYMTPGTCSKYNGCSNGQCQSSSSKDFCSPTTPDRLNEYYVNGNLCSSVTKNCNDYDKKTANLTTGICEWYDYGCAESLDGGACAPTDYRLVSCINSDAVADEAQDTCDWWKQNVTAQSCTIGCTGDGCCAITNDYNVDCDNYDQLGQLHTLVDWEVTQQSCKVECQGAGCCEPRNYRCDEACKAVLVEGQAFWCSNEGTWVTQLPQYCTPQCQNDRDAPNIDQDSMTDDGVIEDDTQAGYKMCVEIFDADGCGIESVEFKTHFFCQDVVSWANYTTVENLGANHYKYCYVLPREIWLDWINRELSWKVKATDFAGNSVESPWNYGGSMIIDDDELGPDFANAVYAKRGTTGWFTDFNKSTPVSIDITDSSGVGLVELSYSVYNYNSQKVELEGSVLPGLKSGSHYDFTIPALCSGPDPAACQYKWKYLNFTIAATDTDNDGWDSDNATSEYKSYLIYIDPPGDQIPQDPTVNAPHITSYSPIDSEVSVQEGNCLTFMAKAEDANGDRLSYRWMLDGKESGSGTTYRYCPANGEVGKHSVRVIVSDGLSPANMEWGVVVTDFVCDTDKVAATTVPSGSGSGGGGTGGPGASASGGGGLLSRLTITTTTTIPKATETQIVYEGGGETTMTTIPNEGKSPLTGLVALVSPVVIVASFAATLFVSLLVLKRLMNRK
ncbi:hypothetical protein A3K63_04160 [Candidatus Micrarchaeota archaeon RBG_16_49_10]|nr:MAG: hypothetical protein A3K63_04160 [Candidatus Micrarchaeota archaeon RBG_16_49_10]